MHRTANLSVNYIIKQVDHLLSLSLPTSLSIYLSLPTSLSIYLSLPTSLSISLPTSPLSLSLCLYLLSLSLYFFPLSLSLSLPCPLSPKANEIQSSWTGTSPFVMVWGLIVFAQQGVVFTPLHLDPDLAYFSSRAKFLWE